MMYLNSGFLIVMWKDPVVAETRSLREEYANRFGHNADEIFQDILQRQAASGKKLVSFKRREPVFSQIDLRGPVGSDPTNPTGEMSVSQA